MAIEDVRLQLTRDLNASGAAIRNAEVLGYQITIVMRGTDGSVMIAHAAVADEDHVAEVSAAVLEKTREAFNEEVDEDADEDEGGQ